MTKSDVYDVLCYALRTLSNDYKNQIAEVERKKAEEEVTADCK